MLAGSPTSLRCFYPTVYPSSTGYSKTEDTSLFLVSAALLLRLPTFVNSSINATNIRCLFTGMADAFPLMVSDQCKAAVSAAV
jgi:hypothetical protein